MTDNPKDGFPFPSFSFDDNDSVVLNTAYIMVSDNHDVRYILGILNSTFGRHLLKLYVSQLGERQYRMLHQFISKVPIPIPSNEMEKSISDLVAKRLTTNEQSKIVESELDKQVYYLYRLNSVEVKYLESL